MSRQIVKIGEYKSFEYYIVEIIYKGFEYYRYWGDNRHWFCGYIAIPENHKLYKETVWDLLDEVEVHGGITYRGWHGDNLDEWVIGFDVNHGMDDSRIENAEYTENECKKLIEQLA